MLKIEILPYKTNYYTYIHFFILPPHLILMRNLYARKSIRPTWRMWKVGKSRDISGKCSGKVGKIFGKTAGNVRDKSGNFREKFGKSSAKTAVNARNNFGRSFFANISRLFPQFFRTFPDFFRTFLEDFFAVFPNISRLLQNIYQLFYTPISLSVFRTYKFLKIQISWF